MKTMRWMMALAAMGAIATACSVKTADNDEDDGSGGSGGSAAVGTGTGTGSTATTSTGTGATTASTTATTSTGGGSTCVGNPFMFNDAACGSCAEAQCCPELQACGSDQKCLEHFQCGQDCIAAMTDNDTTKACLEACDTTHPEGKALMDAIDTCTETKCSMECPQSEPICDSGWVISGTGSSIAACGMCLGDKCCTEYTACADDTDCSECVLNQNQASCDKGMLDEGVKTCRDTNCKTECGG